MQHDFILLDRSGSMSSIWDECISSINSYAKDLKERKVDTGITVITFDRDGARYKFEVIRDRITAETFKPINPVEENIQPRGMTPLNDSIARIIDLAEAGGYDKVAMIIVTDGLENASVEYLDHSVIKAKLDACRAKGWQVIFIGANFDNAAQASSYGNAAAQTASVARGRMGLMANKLGATRAAYASGEAATMDFADDDKAELSGQS